MAPALSFPFSLCLPSHPCPKGLVWGKEGLRSTSQGHRSSVTLFLLPTMNPGLSAALLPGLPFVLFGTCLQRWQWQRGDRSSGHWSALCCGLSSGGFEAGWVWSPLSCASLAQSLPSLLHLLFPFSLPCSSSSLPEPTLSGSCCSHLIAGMLSAAFCPALGCSGADSTFPWPCLRAPRHLSAPSAPSVHPTGQSWAAPRAIRKDVMLRNKQRDVSTCHERA